MTDSGFIITQSVTCILCLNYCRNAILDVTKSVNYSFSLNKYLTSFYISLALVQNFGIP